MPDHASFLRAICERPIADLAAACVTYGRRLAGLPALKTRETVNA